MKCYVKTGKNGKTKCVVDDIPDEEEPNSSEYINLDENTDIKPEQVFLNRINKLVKNLLIDNPNYTNRYYYQDRGLFGGIHELINDTKERAGYILREIDAVKHLIGLEEDNG